MGELLKVLAYDRNTLKESASASIRAVQTAIAAVQAKTDLSNDKGLSNIRGACASYLGLFRKTASGEYELTEVAEWYSRLHQQRGEDAWRWLLTRSLWRYVLPNGTGTAANVVAEKKQLRGFEFFRLILQILVHLSGLADDSRFLSYEEFCLVFDKDENWTLSPWQLTEKILTLRGTSNKPKLRLTRKFLDDLEDDYTPGKRDNLNTWFNKAFDQTGLFDYKTGTGGAKVGIALKSAMDPVLQRRVRFILDHPVSWRAV